MPWNAIVRLGILFACLPSAPALATVVLPADFDTVVSESGMIVHGRVVDVRSELTGPRRVIESVVTVRVLESFKGAAEAIVAFRVPNGQVGRYRRILVGAPELTAGDEVVVFLTGRPPALPTLFGLSQGLYRVTRTGSALATVTPPPVAAAGGRIVRGDPARSPIPIEAFTRDVRARVERAR